MTIAAFSSLNGKTSGYRHLVFDFIAFICLKRLEQLFVDSFISVESSLSMPMEFYLFIPSNLRQQLDFNINYHNHDQSSLQQNTKQISLLLYDQFMDSQYWIDCQCGLFIIQINIFNMMTIPEVAAQEISQENIQKRRKIEQEVETILKEMGKQVQFVLSSGPYHEYFLGQQAKKLKMKEMNAKYNNAITSKLFMEIQTGKTKVNKNKTSYVIEPKSQKLLEEMIEKDKNELRLKKKHAMQALSDVLREENQLVKHERSLKENRSFNKSELYTFVPENPEWKSHLKLAIRRKRQLERSFQMKSEQAEKRAESLKQQQIRAKKQRLQRQKQKHIKLLQSRRQKQAIQKKKQKQSKHKCKQLVHKSRPSKYRFQLMSERDQQALRKKEQEREQKMKQYRQMKQQKYDWTELKQHESKYFQTINEKKEQWVKKFEDSISRVHKKHPKSVFASRIQQEQNYKQMQERAKQNRKHQFLDKIREYGASVLQNHMPRKFIKSTNQLMKNDSKTVRQSLNRFQQRQRGLTYLGEAKKHRKLTQDINNSSNLKPASSLPAIKAPIYKDYLKQQPRRAKQGTSFYTVLSQKKGEWAANAKTIIQRMDVTNKKSNQKMLDSAFKKIELLKAIM